jgi:hypothetical protein
MGGVGEWEGEWCGRPRRQCPRGRKMKKYTIIEPNKGKFKKFDILQFIISVRNCKYSPRRLKTSLRH